MPQVYAAKYSNVPVWVVSVNNVSVMRRQGDGWVNATHILKVADFDKPRRTRILERDVQIGEHEKVQGGYGKYQGTWIPIERAILLSQQVNVMDQVEDLLNYVPQEGEEIAELPRQPKPAGSRKQSDTGPNGAPKPKKAKKVNSMPTPITQVASQTHPGVVGPPTYAAPNGPLAPHQLAPGMAPRAQAMQSLPLNTSYQGMSWGQFSPQSPYAPHQLSAMPMAPMAGMPGQFIPSGYYMGDPSAMSPGGVGAPSPITTAAATASGNSSSVSAGQLPGPQGLGALGNAPHSLTANTVQHFGTGGYNSSSSSPSLSSSNLSEGFSDHETDASFYTNQSIRGQAGASGRPGSAGRPGTADNSGQDPARRGSSADGSAAAAAAAAAAGAGASAGKHSTGAPDSAIQAAAARADGWAQGPSQYMADYSAKLLDFFMSPDKSIIPSSLLAPQPGPHINQPIDDEGNTAFHWTCAIGRVELMQALLAAGANTRSVNHLGQTPLVRAVLFTNNYEARTFPQVLNLLADTIPYIDGAGKTVLHHIAATASASSRSAGARYYAELVLSRVPLLDGLTTSSVAQLLDYQDHQGDTALHNASRAESRRMVKVLLSHGASPHIQNKSGQTAEQLFAQMKKSRGSSAHHHHHTGTNSSYLKDARYDVKPELYLSDDHADTSESVKASQEAAKSIAGYLKEIATTFDQDLYNKDSDILQVKELIERIRQDASELETTLPELEEEYSQEKLDKQIEELSVQSEQKQKTLQQLLERSQSRNLALLVQKEEGAAKEEVDEQLKDSFHIELPQQQKLSEDLLGLQSRRRELVDEIVRLYSVAGSPEKIAKYRKLLAVCCEVPEEEVDGLLDGINKALESNGP